MRSSTCFLISASVLLPLACAVAANCPAGGATAIYVNGINNDAFEAYRSLVAAQSAVSSSLAITPGAPAPECVAFRLAYNDTQGFLLDLFEAARQKFIESPIEQTYRWLANYDPAPDWFQQAFANKIAALNDSAYVRDPVLQNVVGFVLEEVRNCNRVVLIAHSQGNFYANRAHRILNNPVGVIPLDSVNIVAVATPSNEVAGDFTNSRYTTLHGDIINLVSTLPPNPPPTPTFPRCLLGPIACHSFPTSYMQGTTRLRIADHITEQLSKVKICAVLKVSKVGLGTGKISSVPDTTVFPPRQIDCGITCEVPFPLNSVVPLTAAADPTFRFEEWSVDCTGTVETVSVTLSSDKTCTAKFGPANVLTVTKIGLGSGTVSSTPAGISCGPACPTQGAPFSGIVQLTAAPAPGSTFAGWGGACSGSALSVAVDVNANKTCTAKFDQPTLTVTKTGTGGGTVTSVPVGINCGPACPSQSAPFTGNVQLTAGAATGSTFTGWGVDCSGTSPTTTVNVSLNKTCTATFTSAAPAVRLIPFGRKSLSDGPFNIEVVSSALAVVPAPGDIAVTLLREVISPCRGVLFSSTRTFTIPQGQSVGGGPDAAGRDPFCNTSPTVTEWTVLGATMAPGTPLDLSVVPTTQLFLAISR